MMQFLIGTDESPPVLVESGADTDARLRSDVYTQYGKRGIDIALVLLSIPIVLPLSVLIAVAIRLGGQSPIYRQQRVGRGNRTFTLWKFRTMVRDGDQILKDHLDQNVSAREEWDRRQKLCDDPRVTKVGSILRKTSLDELPQLLNVLVGDMALVGPRPMLPEQRAMYSGRAYYHLRPGITGIWQISERNSCAFGKRAYFDGIYAVSVSLGTDLAILAKTAAVVMKGTGC